jgi:hypothetical protein
VGCLNDCLKGKLADGTVFGAVFADSCACEETTEHQYPVQFQEEEIVLPVSDEV